MKGKLGQALQFIIFFGLGAGLMWWQYSKFTPEQKEQFFNGLSSADYTWFVVAMLIGALAHLARALRWKLLLAPLGRKAGLGSRFYAVMIGYLANYAFPRLGEVTRCGVIKSSDDIPFGESFGTVVVERIVDLLCLALVFVIVFLIQFSQLNALWQEYIWIPAGNKLYALSQQPVKMYSLIALAVIFIGTLIIFRKKIGGKISGKAGGFLMGIRDGILSIRKVPNPVVFILYSLAIWFGYLMSLYVCFFCFPETSGLSFNTALILLLFGTFGVAFTPGGIGAYQLIVTEIMIALAPSSEPAAASFSWLSWGTQVATVVVFAGIAFGIRPLLNKLKS